MEALATGYGLVEGPLWRPGEGLYWSDVLNGGVYRRSPSGDVATVLEHRRGIGGLAWHAAGGLVVAAQHRLQESRRLALRSADGRGRRPGARGIQRSHDRRCRADLRGLARVPRIQRRPPTPGYLHVIDLDGTAASPPTGSPYQRPRVLAGRPAPVRLGRPADVVRVYDVEADGPLSPWRTFGRLAGTPDGLAVAADGSVWVALAQRGSVALLEPDARERRRVPVPLPMVTSVCFCGGDLRDLYVAEGSRGGRRKGWGTVSHAGGGARHAPAAARVALPRG